MNFKSLGDLDRDILRWIPSLPPGIEAIVAIPRSGLLVGSILSLQTNLPMTDVERFLEGRLIESGLSKRTGWSSSEFFSRRRKVLVLDDSVCSGTQLKKTRADLAPMAEKHDLVFGALYVVPGAESFVDCHLEVLPAPRLFAWNLMHSTQLADACVDIDGILCRDPLAEENDDGPKYDEFLRTVPPKIKPSRKIRALVTCRLEKYRPQTAQWLRNNGIDYEELVMWNLPDGKARLAHGGHGAFKAGVYTRLGTSLFIESSASQAVDIARHSGKWVVCFDTGELVSPNEEAEALQAASNSAKVRATATLLYFYHLAAGFKRLLLRK